MRKLTLILLLIFTVMLSSPSHAKWTKVGGSVLRNTFYVDFERIRKVDGYVYYWILTDYLKPTKHGDLSGKTYYQGDCKLFRHKILTGNFYTEPMGHGKIASSSNIPDKEWTYPSPNTVGEVILKKVCKH